MADISTKVTQIRSAVYGKDVRESIASGIEAINTESELAKKTSEDAAAVVTHAPQINSSDRWEVWDAASKSYKDTGISAAGPTGPMGSTGAIGPQGPTGPAFSFGDSYNTLADLQAAHPTNDGKGHLVGSVIYVWANSGWAETSIPAPDMSNYLKKTDVKPIATSGKYNDLEEKPDLAALATAVQSAKIGDTVITKTGTELQLPAYPVVPASLPANGGNAATVGGYTIVIQAGEPATVAANTLVLSYDTGAGS